jgi:hypothetical protein
MAPVRGELDDVLVGGGFKLDRLTVTAGSAKAGEAMPTWKPGGICDDVGPSADASCSTTCVEDCAALRDDDGDQYPGVTLELCGKTKFDVRDGNECHIENPNEAGATLQGKAFIGLEIDPQISGKAVSSCEMQGSIDTSFRLSVVGADVYLAGLPVPVSTFVGSVPEFSVDASSSAVRLVRIDGQYGAPDFDVHPSDKASACAAILAKKDELN